VLEPELLVYYIMDDYPLMPGVNTRAVMELERRLFEMSDVVFATAEHLKKSKSNYDTPITVLPHGVEFEHFHGPRPDPPPELADLPRPIIGFFGLIAPWIDVAMMRNVAVAAPNYSFVFIGDVQTPLAGLDALPNVRMIPKLAYSDLPRYARHFDVSTLPFIVNEMTLNVNPLKLMEYFAVGAPVVSTPLPEVEKHKPHVRIADSAETFGQALRNALIEDSDQTRIERIALARAHSWDALAEQASSIIEEALYQKRSRT
jgi:glycosyltransferase involved in cell wall biosynthesis